MVQLFGRVTDNAKVTELKDGKKVVNFSIALNDSYKPKDGERVEQVTFIRCAYWRNTGVAEFLTKGKQVEIFCRLFPDAYINQQGDAVGTINATVKEINLRGGGATHENTNETKPPQKAGRRKANAKKNQPATIVEIGDDLPF